MNAIYRLMMMGLLLLAVLFFSPARAGLDEDNVKQVLMSMFDKHDNRLNIGPVIISGDHGIADWHQGETGGRALLQRKDGKWTLRLCSGDGLKRSSMLVEAGIDTKVAEEMTAALSSAESSLDPAVVAKYALFEGTMVMDGSQ